ncbi:hypothetical protein ANCDUO_14347, partial [Ancylostoma duodenale]
NGWKESEIYATTYGDGGKTAAPMVDMKCDYVRWLIQAVAEFTRRRVDVIGYSMGSPISRKEIKSKVQYIEQVLTRMRKSSSSVRDSVYNHHSLSPEKPLLIEC